MRLAWHQRFGASSEKTEEDSAEQLRFLFNGAEVYAEKPAAVVAVYKRHQTCIHSGQHTGRSALRTDRAPFGWRWACVSVLRRNHERDWQIDGQQTKNQTCLGHCGTAYPLTVPVCLNRKNEVIYESDI